MTAEDLPVPVQNAAEALRGKVAGARVIRGQSGERGDREMVSPCYSEVLHGSMSKAGPTGLVTS